MDEIEDIPVIARLRASLLSCLHMLLQSGFPVVYICALTLVHVLRTLSGFIVGMPHLYEEDRNLGPVRSLEEVYMHSERVVQ
jgi:hypothetical protein